MDVIREVNARFSKDIMMGVGTILDTETCKAALLAGASFVVTPMVITE